MDKISTAHIADLTAHSLSHCLNACNMNYFHSTISEKKRKITPKEFMSSSQKQWIGGNKGSHVKEYYLPIQLALRTDLLDV